MDELRRPKVLVTGGSGYFGSLLISQLVEQEFEVFNFDIHPPQKQDACATFIQGDIRDVSAVERATKGMEIVFHNVAQVPLAKNASLFESVNITGTRVLLQSCLANSVSKVVYTSSSAVFGIPDSNPVNVETQKLPVEAYGRAKLEGEFICKEFIDQGLDVTIVRPRTIIGHGRLGIFGILFDWVADGAAIFVFDKGENYYQFVHAEDLSSAIILAGKSAGPSEFNIGSQSFGSMYETLADLCEFAGTKSRVVSLPSTLIAPVMKFLASLRLVPFAEYHWKLYSKSLWFDTTRASTELGWESKFTNSEAIIDSYKWYIENRFYMDDDLSMHRKTAKQGVLKIAKAVMKLV